MSESNLYPSLRDDLANLAAQSEQKHNTPKLDQKPKLEANSTTNASLWLDKLLHTQIEGSPGEYQHPYITHIKAICEVEENKAYKTFFEDRWLPSLPQKNLRVARVIGRLVIGLGSESAWENNITLHRTYGVPYIPGSALKGLAAAYAHKYLEEGVWNKAYTKKDEQGIGTPIPIGDAHKIMFGDTTSEGYVTFFDALYVPGSGYQGKALWPDVITVHHPEYYRETKQEGKDEIVPPADWDDPTPISFMSATGKYLIALDGPEEWVEAAFKIIEMAVADMGVGAKTSSGYGRMRYLSTEEQEKCLKQFRKQKMELPDYFISSINTATKSSLSSKINLLRGLPEELRQEGAEMIIKQARSLFGEEIENKPWFQEIHKYVL